MMKRGMVDKQEEYMVASYRVSKPGLQMLGSNECDVSYQCGTQALFQYQKDSCTLYSHALEES